MHALALTRRYSHTLTDTHRHQCGLTQQTIQVDSVLFTSSIVVHRPRAIHQHSPLTTHHTPSAPHTAHRVTKSPSRQVAKSPSRRRTCACSYRRTSSSPQVHTSAPLSQLVLGRIHHSITLAHAALRTHNHRRPDVQRRLQVQLDSLHQIAPSRNSPPHNSTLT